MAGIEELIWGMRELPDPLPPSKFSILPAAIIILISASSSQVTIQNITELLLRQAETHLRSNRLQLE
jgi:hypothetical protein